MVMVMFHLFFIGGKFMAFIFNKQKYGIPFLGGNMKSFFYITYAGPV